MPFTPAPAPSANTDTPFDKTLTVAGTAEDLVTVPAGLVGMRFSVINRGPGVATIAFDRTATPADTRLHAGESYSEDGINVVTRVSFINVTAGKEPRLTGVLWSG